MYNRFLKDEKGFTGLEAAIVLIAFVVVAAVFSYVMLGAGFFTTQKSQEVVHTGVTQASSSLAPSGDLIVRGGVDTDNANASCATQIILYVANTAGGTPVDLDKTILTYTDNENFVTKEYVVDSTTDPDTKGAVAIPADGAWTNTFGWVYNGVVVTRNDNLLEQGEKYKVVIDLTKLIGTINATHPLPVANEKFKLELKPPEGAVLAISKTLPPSLVTDNYYPVY